MTNSKILLSIVATLSITTLSSAMEFQVLGAKAASMGGAGVATSPSSLAAYNNPALLANNPEKFSIHVGAGVSAKDAGAGRAIGDLNDLDFSSLSDAADGNVENLSQNDINTLNEARDIIVDMNKKGFAVNGTADLGISFGSFGTGVFGNIDIGGIANVDQTHTAMIFEGSTPGTYFDITSGTPVASDLATYNATSMQYAIDNGLTNVDVVGLAVYEIPLAYGYSFSTGYGKLALGGAIKYMSGKSYYESIALDDDNALDDIDQNSVTSSTYGVDLGLAYSPEFLKDLTLAVVGKNLNTPKFDRIGGGEFEIEPAVRAGAAYKFGNWVELAMDVDLTENDSISGYKTQYVGGGVNLDLSFIEFNAGLMQNLSSNDQAGLIYTAGIATGPDWLHFELTGQMSSKSGEIDGENYPKQVMVNLAISSAW